MGATLILVLVVCISFIPFSSSAGKAACHNPMYGTCYGINHNCPASCPTLCEVNCRLCKPYCGRLLRSFVSSPFLIDYVSVFVSVCLRVCACVCVVHVFSLVHTEVDIQVTEHILELTFCYVPVSVAHGAKQIRLLDREASLV